MRLKLTPDGATAPFYVSVYDTSWNASYWKKTINTETPPEQLTRNITVSIAIVDGNYTNNKAAFFSCEGKFFPEAQKGVGDCKYNYGFASPKFKGDEEKLKSQAVDK